MHRPYLQIDMWYQTDNISSTITASGQMLTHILVFLKLFQKFILEHGILAHVQADLFMHVRYLGGWTR